MKNIMTTNGVRAVIQYDPEIGMFRGEFTGLNGGADFYGKDINSFKLEGEINLRVFLEMRQKDGVDPSIKIPANSGCACLANFTGEPQLQ